VILTVRREAGVDARLTSGLYSSRRTYTGVFRDIQSTRFVDRHCLRGLTSVIFVIVRPLVENGVITYQRLDDKLHVAA